MIKIKIVENGPYRIDADDAVQVVIVDAAGNEIPSPRPDKKAISLCRCGASKTKPFCDGTHKTLVPAVFPATVAGSPVGTLAPVNANVNAGATGNVGSDATGTA